jgi:Mycothiol maleylpyruvate isomerase N-terminal domain
MDAAAVAQMLRHDREEWQALVAALEERPSAALHDPESPAWEAKDVYAHLARWMDNSTDALEAWLDGRRLIPPPKGTDDEINDRWQAEDAAFTLAEARERAQRAFARRSAAIEAVPPERWDKDTILERMARADGYEHYASHRRYIEAGGRERE